ncbi:hypothetical protein F5X96DRAFT_627006 [Biscogniauxia mediterranea]|nr:hypothetical protein F5X96DRAFT_627006 [Biscogniauxia mediterranea]
MVPAWLRLRCAFLLLLKCQVAPEREETVEETYVLRWPWKYQYIMSSSPCLPRLLSTFRAIGPVDLSDTWPNLIQMIFWLLT